MVSMVYVKGKLNCWFEKSQTHSDLFVRYFFPSLAWLTSLPIAISFCFSCTETATKTPTAIRQVELAFVSRGLAGRLSRVALG